MGGIMMNQPPNIGMNSMNQPPMSMDGGGGGGGGPNQDNTPSMTPQDQLSKFVETL